MAMTTTTTNNSCKPANKKTKTVSFQESTTIRKLKDLDAEPSWHTLEDRKRFIMEARIETNAWINKRCYQFLLKDTFHHDPDCSESQATEVQEKLNAYTQLPGDNYCRGLERHVCREHGLKRDGMKKGAIRTIVNESRKRKERDMPIDQAWMQLGEISRHLTRHATRFARHVGAADELATRQGEDVSKVNKLRSEEIQKMVQKMNTTQPASPPCSCPSAAEEATEAVQDDEDEDATKAQERSNSPTSVTTVNGWCHGPRESLLQAPQVPNLG